MRIAIVGNSGSGKSTLAAQIAACHALRSLDLDAVAWEPGRVAVPRDPAEASRDVASFCEGEARWVVEGCYASLVEAALRHGPILLFLDPGVEACLANCRDRPWEPHKYTSKAEQDERLAFLLSWAEEYYRREGEMSLGAHRALFESYPGPKLRVTGRVTPDWIAALDKMVQREEPRP